MKDQIEIGTIEPNFKNNLDSDGVSFIVGAIDKYGDNKEYYVSLIEYLKKQINRVKE